MRQSGRGLRPDRRVREAPSTGHVARRVRGRVSHVEHTAEILLAGRCTNTDGDIVGGVRETLKVADRDGHEVRRHAGRGCEHQCVSRVARPRRIREQAAIGDGRVAAIDGEVDVERGLHGRFIEAREGPTRVARLELCDRVIAPARPTQVEAAELAVERARIADSYVGGPGRNGARNGQCDRLRAGVRRDSRALMCGARPDHHIVEGEVQSVQHDPGGRPIQLNANRLGALEQPARQVDVEREVVVIWPDAGGKSFCRGIKGREAEQKGQDRQEDRRPPQAHCSSVPADRPRHFSSNEGGSWPRTARPGDPIAQTMRGVDRGVLGETRSSREMPPRPAGRPVPGRPRDAAVLLARTDHKGRARLVGG